MSISPVKYSNELNDVISYMKSYLLEEFPTDKITVEYMLTSIINFKTCNASRILDYCLMSSNLEQLNEIYTSYLEKNKKYIPYKKKNENIAYDSALTTVFENAVLEQKLLGAKVLSSEHILLAMLNSDCTKDTIQNVFKQLGIEYSFLFGRCAEQMSMNKIKNNKQKNDSLIPSNETASSQKFKNNIEKYTTNITNLAKNGKLDKLIGRRNELDKIIKILARRDKNNVIIVGEGGVGKTMIVHGLAQLIASGNVPYHLLGKEILKLDVMALISGTTLRGAFEERIKGLLDELYKTNKYILFIDDMSSVLKGISKEKDSDMTSFLPEILDNKSLNVIGTVTQKEYRNSIEHNQSIARKIQKVIVEPASFEDTLSILNTNKIYYEEYHNVKFTDDAIVKCIKLSQRYITDRKLPDSAIDVLDTCGAYTCLINNKTNDTKQLISSLKVLEKEKKERLKNGDYESVEKISESENDIKEKLEDLSNSNKINEPFIIDADFISNVISDLTNIPVSKLSVDEKEKMANMELTLKEHIIGQDEAVETICKVIKRNRIGLGNKNKSGGVIFAAGPSGCGKTALAKKIAEEIFGDEKALIRFDMSEYSEKSNVSKLLGSSPGYIGYENGGLLTEAIKNKQYCVLLLDEIEKAHQDVYNIFLQLFDEGRLTDSNGQIVNFKNVIVIMTSNIGIRRASEMGNGIGFVTNAASYKSSIIEKQLKQKFSPEFLNRIDKIVYFNTLTDDNLRDIVKLELKKLNKNINELGYEISWDEETVSYISEYAIKEKEYGARPIIRAIQNEIEDKLTDLLIENDYEKHHIFNIKTHERTVQII